MENIALRVLLYSHFFAPSVGGVETVVLSLARGLIELRTADGNPEFEVTVVTQTPADSFNDGTLPFMVVRRPGSAQLARMIRAADVIHIAGPALAPLFWSWLLRKPFVVEHHGFQAICPNGQLFVQHQGVPCPGHFMARRHAECLRCNAGQGRFASLKMWFLAFIRRLVCFRASANITPTRWLEGQLRLPRVVTIPHGLGPSPLLARRNFFSGEPPVIAFQGRLVSTKGIGVLFDAARILAGQKRAFQLIVIGDGPERSRLERLAEEPPLAGCVRFAGRLDPGRLEEALAQAAMVVVPSLAGEVFGLVIAENMLRGLPIIASNLGAFVEVLGDAGLTFRVGDASDLARRLAELLDDASRRVNLGTEARQRAAGSYRSRVMVEDHAGVYRRLLA